MRSSTSRDRTRRLAVRPRTLNRTGTALLAAGLILLARDAWACAVCIGWTEGQGLNAGFYWSALLLTALPFAVVAVIGAWLGCAARRTPSRRRR